MAKKKEKVAATVSKPKKTTVTQSEGMMLLSFKCCNDSKHGHVERDYAGKHFKHGETHPVSAKLKNAIDDGMKEIGFSIKSAPKSKINAIVAEENKSPEIPEVPETINEENK